MKAFPILAAAVMINSLAIMVNGCEQDKCTCPELPSRVVVAGTFTPEMWEGDTVWIEDPRIHALTPTEFSVSSDSLTWVQMDHWREEGRVGWWDFVGALEGWWYRVTIWRE